jgi:nucleotide-binding universal stress UspA family protein
LTHKKRAIFRNRWRAGITVEIHGSNMKRQNVRNILVPIDFSTMSIQAIETAKRLAQRFGATVHLAHVRQFYYPAGFTAPMPPVVPFSVVSYDQEAEKTTARQLNALTAKHGLSRATCHLLSGAPAFDEICRLAQEIPADLIVMPTHGRTGLKHVFLGSTAERVVQHSPCPVFVARRKAQPSKNVSRFTLNTILVPIDFSDFSLEGLNYAIWFADKFAANIFLLNAVHFGYAYTSDGHGMYDLSALQEPVRQGAEEQMRGVVRRAKFGGIKFDTKVKVGVPFDVICTVAQENNIDLIITATHGRTGFKHVLIGSTAEQVVRHAPCPVLVVPSHPKIRIAKLTRQAERRRKTDDRIANRKAQKYLIEREQLIHRYRKLGVHAFPERRKTNKFRESHSS